ncbi:MAG: CdaR family protein [Paraclostridium sp.]|uniref:CdaR family protein n=1 Tax=Paraclostridium sp. TaxID=2023273 RepID=UPI003F2E23DC
MINKLKNNTKIKMISLLSALVLWLYVMTVEDPVETRNFGDIPITITNMSMLEDRGLAIYPKEELFADISIKGNLSSLRPINKDNIYIYGRLDDPKEGKNAIYLQANLPERVNKYDIKPSVITVDLEKVVTEKRSIEVEVEGKSKTNIDNIQKNKETVNIRGPRSVVNKVTSVKAILDVSEKEKDFSTKLKLVPVDKLGNEVTGVKLDEDFIVANVKFLQQKVVPVNLKLEGNTGVEENLKNYKISPNEVSIEGKKEELDSIQSINTQPIKVEDLKSTGSIEVKLDIPKGIKVNDNISIVKVNLDKNITNEFLVPKSEINIITKENDKDKDIDFSKVPENIKVSVIHSGETPDISKSDIELYIDMNDNSQGEGKYIIKCKSKYDFKEIKIEPEIVDI